MEAQNQGSEIIHFRPERELIQREAVGESSTDNDSILSFLLTGMGQVYDDEEYKEKFDDKPFVASEKAYKENRKLALEQLKIILDRMYGSSLDCKLVLKSITEPYMYAFKRNMREIDPYNAVRIQEMLTWAASHTLKDQFLAFTKFLHAHSSEDSNFEYLHKDVQQYLPDKHDWIRFSTIFLVNNPLTYYKLCQSLYCGSLGKDSYFTKSGFKMGAFLKRFPKRVPETGVICHALLDQLYDMLKFSQQEFTFDPMAMVHDLRGIDKAQISGETVVFSMDVPAFCVRALSNTLFSYLHSLFEREVTADEALLRYAMVTFELPRCFYKEVIRSV